MLKERITAVSLIAILTIGASAIDVNAVPLMQPANAFRDAVSPVTEPVVVRRGAVAVRGPRGGVAVRRTTVVRPGVRPVHPIARPGVRPVHPIARPGRPWVRPPHYTWRPGGAIAAGAALGFVTAATIGTYAVYAGAPPAPGYCWYYTDPTRTKGFWDVCP
jgi:hypothetical protein